MPYVGHTGRDGTGYPWHVTVSTPCPQRSMSKPAQHASVDSRRCQVAPHEGCDRGALALMRIAAADILRRGVGIIRALHTECHRGRGERVLLLTEVTVHHVCRGPSS
jgi:hypothetical protein